MEKTQNNLKTFVKIYNSVLNRILFNSEHIKKNENINDLIKKEVEYRCYQHILKNQFKETQKINFEFINMLCDEFGLEKY